MAGAREVRVLVVHRDGLIAEALKRALSAERGLRAVGALSEPTQAIEAAADRPPEVALVDLALPGDSAIEAVRRIGDVAPHTAILALSNSDDLAIARAVEAGAAGHVSSSASLRVLAESVRRAARGDTLVAEAERRELLRRLRHRRAQQASAVQRTHRLTPREVEILQSLADGVRRNELAATLGMSPATLRTHVQNIITKLGVHSKTEALAFAIRHGRVSART
jgi:NarL family two-component system response regulator LiaR